VTSNCVENGYYLSRKEAVPTGGEGCMDEDREQKVAELKQRIEQGQYLVDPGAVADAIVRRWGELAAAHGEHRQNECSYPERVSGASRKVTPLGPSTTHPIQYNRGWLLLWRVFGGMQTHSS
jgi:hypothetical protein